MSTSHRARGPRAPGRIIVVLAIAVAAVASGTAQNPPPAPPPPPQATLPNDSNAAPDRVLVQFRPGAGDLLRTAARAAVGATLSRSLRMPDGRLELLTIARPVAEAVRILSALPQVEFAEPDWIIRASATPNDPYYVNGSQWGLYGDATTPVNPFGSQAGEMWARDFTGSGTTYVGVIDTGIEFNHPDLAANVWTNPFDPVDGVDNDGNGFVDDIHGWDFWTQDNSVYDGPVDDHGTHVAGIIGARGGDGLGVAGVTWDVRIVPMKFLGPSTGFTSDVVEALNYLIDLKTRHGLDVIAANASFDAPSYSMALHRAVLRAAKHDILFVASAGNAAQDADATAVYPSGYTTLQPAGSESAASYEAVIAVAAIESSGALAGFSNYGATTVDIAAPGVQIISTFPQGGYQSLNGTSMAAPHVTGAIALLRSLAPTATAATLRTLLLTRAEPTPSLAGRTATGGRLDLSDFAVPTHSSFTDPTLIPGLHPIKAVHVTELRTRINALRQQAGLPAVAWTDATPGPTVQVKAVHFSEMRSALVAVYQAAGRTPPTFTDPALSAGVTIIRAAHITDLRAAVLALEP